MCQHLQKRFTTHEKRLVEIIAALDAISLDEGETTLRVEDPAGLSARLKQRLSPL